MPQTQASPKRGLMARRRIYPGEVASMMEGEDSPAAASDKDKAMKTHFKVIRFIMEEGVKLGMQSIPIATACTIYHKFFHETKLDDYDPYLVAMSAIYLAGKVEEQHLRTRDIINVCHRYLNPGSDPLEVDAKFWELRDSIVQCELLVLRLLHFHVSFNHPHKYLLHYLLSLKNWMNRHSWERNPIATASWALLRDSYYGDICLRYDAQHIAVSVIYFALQCYGVEVPGNESAEKQWWKVFSEDISKTTINNIISELIQIYTMDTEIP